jgi:hypothetical protein
MQASQQKPNYKKGLTWKGSCGFHTDNKGKKQSPANPHQGQVSTHDESTQTKAVPYLGIPRGFVDSLRGEDNVPKGHKR